MRSPKMTSSSTASTRCSRSLPLMGWSKSGSSTFSNAVSTGIRWYHRGAPSSGLGGATIPNVDDDADDDSEPDAEPEAELDAEAESEEPEAVESDDVDEDNEDEEA